MFRLGEPTTCCYRESRDIELCIEHKCSHILLNIFGPATRSYPVKFLKRNGRKPLSRTMFGTTRGSHKLRDSQALIPQVSPGSQLDYSVSGKPPNRGMMRQMTRIGCGCSLDLTSAVSRVHDGRNSPHRHGSLHVQEDFYVRKAIAYWVHVPRN